ncbi:MAG: hypothetical protein LBD28_01790 [Tannerellaceae bacterium]|jgi:hypothetical protein|nr:hypothetical protein [Tannerellaceae bacterium]
MEKTLKIFAKILLVGGCLFLAACSINDGGGELGSPDQGVGGSMARFTVKGDYLYAVTESALKTFDIADAAKPRYLSGKEQTLSMWAETIFPLDSFLLIGSQQGMYIYSIARDGFPQQIAVVRHFTSCDPVVASGNYAYVTLHSDVNSRCGRGLNRLEIYDITDHTDPVLVHAEEGLIRPLGLGVDGNKLFVCDNGLKVYDISNPINPIWTGDITHIPELDDIQPYDVIPLHGTLLLVGQGGFYQLDYSGEKLSLISKITVTKE